jgi:hypothetical protein
LLPHEETLAPATLEIRLARSFRAVIAVWFGCLNLGAGGAELLDSHKALMTFLRWAAEEEYGDGWSSPSGGMPARRARSRGVVRARTTVSIS